MADTLTAPANYIAGEWRPSAGGDTYEKRNPARPDELVGEFPSSAARGRRPGRRGGFRRPSRLVARADRERAAVLSGAAASSAERAEAIAQDMTREMGKPLREARMEAARPPRSCATRRARRSAPSAELFQQAVTGGPVYTVHRAVGVVGLITPWNFPAADTRCGSWRRR
jgi:aldehyde dehydrogenase (NAD+)